MSHDAPHEGLARLRRLLAPVVFGSVGLTAPLLVGCRIRCTDYVPPSTYEVPLAGFDAGMDLSWIDEATCLSLCRTQGYPAATGCEVDGGVVVCRGQNPGYGGCMSAGRPPAGGFGYEAAFGWGGPACPERAEEAATELASVGAFLRLARALEAHGLPPALVRSARRCAADEVRHAGLRLAAAGGQQLVVRLPVRVPETLAALALDNATSGCVMEAFGAHLAALEASAASTPVDRAVAARIAYDEAAHALHSLALDRVLQARLPERTRRDLAGARHDSTRALARSVVHDSRSSAAFEAAFGRSAAQLAA